MMFFHPGAQYRFEIPDDWLQAAGVLRFMPRRLCYAHTHEPQWPTATVGIFQVGLPPGCMAPAPFAEQRMVDTLRAMATGQPLAPLWCSQEAGAPRLTLRHGLHRYHAAVALRFRQVPVSVRPHFQLG
ncbi:hypothetical protein [Pseudorhodoferax sp. Leaf267]|uniref:hypothetical protein n=1 Tax=Pseudorhodoferax sp. Leaf267 TaxID=1736316 RepID=UPI0006FAD504|nr:hypothetical protein [Pseudorhodoferax sp. Leaf267]KQP18050.1 hypothetical protein ASF43_09350 [Pseudorhodoferax sp. Leaf267]